MATQKQGAGISWTQQTWNPVRGCTRVSEGCRNCYAESVAARFSGPGLPYEGLAKQTPSGPRWTGKMAEVEEHLDDPLRWQRPRLVFVNSMSDLFHEGVSGLFIDRVFSVMQRAERHTFQVLTKRPERMWALVHDYWKQQTPPANIWWGVSAEDQATAEERVPFLLNMPAAVRWVSAEPLLGPISFLSLTGGRFHRDAFYGSPKLDWVVVGGESGRGARPMKDEWARLIRDQCRAAGVAFHFKQYGSATARALGLASSAGKKPEEWPVPWARDYPKGYAHASDT